MDIVVIDDNADIRETMQSLLECLGHRVVTAADGPTGVDLVLRQRPHVALVDIGLPGFDGYTVAEKIRATIPAGQLRLSVSSGRPSSAQRSRPPSITFTFGSAKSWKTQKA